MRNKRGILGAIFLTAAIIIFLMAAFFYHQIKTNGLSITTGRFIINIGYNNSPLKTPEILLPEQSQFPNDTKSNAIAEENNFSIEEASIIDYNSLNESQ